MDINKKAKFKFYQLPTGEDIFAKLGSNEIKEYGLNSEGQVVDTNHYHNLMEFSICRFGKGRVIFNDEVCTYDRGTIIVVPRNYPHTIISEHGEKCYWESIYINPVTFLMEQYDFGKRDIDKAIHRIEQRPLLLNDEKVPMLTQELECIMNQLRTRGYGYKNCLKGLIYAMLMEIVKINYSNSQEKGLLMHTYYEETNYKLKLAIEYINDNYASDIRMSDISDAAYISESYLRSLFTSHYGVSPLKYVDYIRITQACKILDTKDKSIAEVARECGFNNMSTFNKNFKKFTGKTPKQYEKENTRKID